MNINKLFIFANDLWKVKDAYNETHYLCVNLEKEYELDLHKSFVDDLVNIYSSEEMSKIKRERIDEKETF